MPYKLRKAPKRNLYWVIAEDGSHKSKEPLPKERAKAQMRALYASMNKRGGADEDEVMNFQDEVEEDENEGESQWSQSYATTDTYIDEQRAENFPDYDLEAAAERRRIQRLSLPPQEHLLAPSRPASAMSRASTRASIARSPTPPPMSRELAIKIKKGLREHASQAFLNKLREVALHYGVPAQIARRFGTYRRMTLNELSRDTIMLDDLEVGDYVASVNNEGDFGRWMKVTNLAKWVNGQVRRNLPFATNPVTNEPIDWNSIRIFKITKANPDIGATRRKGFGKLKGSGKFTDELIRRINTAVIDQRHRGRIVNESYVEEMKNIGKFRLRNLPRTSSIFSSQEDIDRKNEVIDWTVNSIIRTINDGYARSDQLRAEEQQGRQSTKIKPPVTIRAKVKHEEPPPELPTCPVCLDPMIPSQKHIGPCGHQIHKDCYSGLRVKNGVRECPLCRRSGFGKLKGGSFESVVLKSFIPAVLNSAPLTKKPFESVQNYYNTMLSQDLKVDLDEALGEPFRSFTTYAQIASKLKKILTIKSGVKNPMLKKLRMESIAEEERETLIPGITNPMLEKLRKSGNLKGKGVSKKKLRDSIGDLVKRERAAGKIVPQSWIVEAVRNGEATLDLLPSSSGILSNRIKNKDRVIQSILDELKEKINREQSSIPPTVSRVLRPPPGVVLSSESRPSRPPPSTPHPSTSVTLRQVKNPILEWK